MALVKWKSPSPSTRQTALRSARAATECFAMPELPEVEIVARALRPRLLGRRILAVKTYTDSLRRPLRLQGKRAFLNRTIIAVRRRAKYLIVEVEGRRVILIHLGMSGACRICPAGEPRRKHEHVIWRLDNGKTWRFEDARRFGMVEVHTLPKVPAVGALPACLDGLPPEPLEEEFTAAYLFEACRRRKRPIKALLMDAGIVAGVGNIYADEALFRAGIRPRRAAGRLTHKECERLVAAIRETLAEAIEAGGTTISDFRSVDGSEGQFQRRLRVYGRNGERCSGCGRAIIKRVVISGRSACYCPVCQK